MTTRWPQVMPDPSVEDFTYGSWIEPATEDDRLRAEAAFPEHLDHYDESVDFGLLPPQRLREAECETRCCLVGHVRVAFGLRAVPDNNFPPQAEKFLRRFCENVGRPISKDIKGAFAVQFAASDVFEGGYVDADHGGEVYLEPLEPEEAVAGWRKTLRDFNYTVRTTY